MSLSIMKRKIYLLNLFYFFLLLRFLFLFFLLPSFLLNLIFNSRNRCGVHHMNEKFSATLKIIFKQCCTVFLSFFFFFTIDKKHFKHTYMRDHWGTFGWNAFKKFINFLDDIECARTYSYKSFFLFRLLRFYGTSDHVQHP